jgi:hypothetical protein
MPPPTGVVSGPLIPIRCSRNDSTVSSGSQFPVASNAFCPASTSIHSMRLPRLATAASMTSWVAGQMSTPVPSPLMNGMMGSSGTFRLPSAAVVIFSGIWRAYAATESTHAPTRSPRIGRRTAPEVNTASWKPRMSKRSPSWARDDSRNRRISR